MIIFMLSANVGFQVGFNVVWTGMMGDIVVVLYIYT